MNFILMKHFSKQNSTNINNNNNNNNDLKKDNEEIEKIQNQQIEIQGIEDESNNPLSSLKQVVKKHEETFQKLIQERDHFKNQVEELNLKISQKGEEGKKFIENHKDWQKYFEIKKKSKELKNLVRYGKLEGQHLLYRIQEEKKKLDLTNEDILQKQIDDLKSEIQEARKLHNHYIEEQKRIDEELMFSGINLEVARSSIKTEIANVKKKIREKEREAMKKEFYRRRLISQINNNFSKEGIIEMRNKAKSLEIELKRTKKQIVEYERAQNQIQPTPLSEMPENKAQWIAAVMKKYPKVLEMRERLRPLQRSLTFGRLKNAAKTEARDALPKDSVIEIIMQYFKQEGYDPIVDYLVDKTGVPYKEPYFHDSGILDLLTLEIRDVSKIWDANLDGVQNPIAQEEIFEKPEDNPKFFQLDDDDVSIWDEPPDNPNNIRYDEELMAQLNDATQNYLNVILFANLNKLIEKLTYHHKLIDHKYEEAFLMTYQSFIKPEHLFFKLLQRMKIPENRPEILSKSRKLILTRVKHIFKVWLEKYPLDIPPKLLEHLKQVLHQHRSKDSTSQRIITLIDQITTSRKNPKVIDVPTSMRKIHKKKFQAPEPLEMEPRIPKNLFSHDLQLSHIDEVELARQMTLWNFAVFEKIEPSELVTQAWSKAKLKHKAPNVTKLIERFNLIVGYVAKEILTPPTAKGRSKQIIRFIKVAEALYELNNFNDLMAIVASLDSSGVKRLADSFSQVPANFINLFTKYKTLLSAEARYKTYREKLSSIRLTCIPYLGMYLSDIVYVSDGSPDKVDGLINFAKRKMLYNIIMEIQKFQQIPYNLTFIFQISVLFEKIELHTDKQLYSLSLEREPRASKK
eukprot:Anaeramoba_ignava/c20235_g1_i1.p1 GENE.c20235_g1_i1~~c20235_g1_i1.p1  ORF type:complete len:856 (-),score=272.99 c20235_g1_i1:35-2602(-)